MSYFVKELTKERVVLVNENGRKLGEFHSVLAAVSACWEDYHVGPASIERYFYGVDNPVDPSKLLAQTGHSAS
tara:strand:+ start:384 stop:602 length:219 start_codon:yes stop_codon:yes gene_type:complete